MWYHFQPKRGYFCRGSRGGRRGSRYSLNSLIYVYIYIYRSPPSRLAARGYLASRLTALGPCVGLRPLKGFARPIKGKKTK